ncbi:hypothetical protein D9M69_643180 [compost metagenome]
MTDQQAAGGAGLDTRQAVGVPGQLIFAGGEQFGGDDLAPQFRLEKLQGRLRVDEVLPQALLGALIDRQRGKALVAVVHQRLIHRRRQAAAIARLGGAQGIVEMRALLRPACCLIELNLRIRQARQAEEQQENHE